MRKLVLMSAVFALTLAQMANAQDPQRGGRPPRGRGMGGFLQRMDKNGDGKITQDEFRGPEALFTRLDENGDGALDEQELRHFGRARQALMWENVDKDALFNELDADGDGVVTRDEFKNADLAKIVGKALMEASRKAGFGRGRPGGGQGGRIGKMLERLDKDGDGKLSKDEFPRPQVFDKLDANGDGFLDKQELEEGVKNMRGRRGRGRGGAE